MGFIDRIRAAIGLPGMSTAGVGYVGLASPWADRPTHLATVPPIVLADVLGTDAALPIDRAAAIRVPALSRSRGLIVGTIPRVPLVALDAAGNHVDVPAWLTSTAGPLTPFHRMLWTVDDLFFYGWSLWAVERDDDDEVIDAYRVEYGRWHFDDDGVVMIDDVPARDDSVVLIPGINGGILDEAAVTLSQASRLAAAATRAADNPSAQVELHQTNDAPMTDKAIDALIARWSAARRGENGGVSFTTSGIEVKEHGASSEHLLIEGRNASAVDIARHAGLPATMIDATLSGSSLSYQNTAARLTELVTFGLSPLMAAIAARLSQDDVTPPGLTIAFDTTDTIRDLAALFGPGDAPVDAITIAPTTTEKDETHDRPNHR